MSFFCRCKDTIIGIYRICLDLLLEADNVEIINKLSRFFAPVEEEIILDDGVVEESAAVARPEAVSAAVESQKVVGGESVAPVAPNPKFDAAVRRQSMKLVSGKEMKIQIYTPQNFDSVSEIADALKSKRSAIVNYERVELSEQRRICDFLNGVCYVQDGEVRRITATMVLYVPDGVEISEVKSVAPAPAQL